MPSTDSTPAAFLDRDGTLVVERHYLSDPAGVALVPGAPTALRRLREAGYALVLVTNQSGIARGLYGDAEFRAVQREIEGRLDASGVRLDGVYHCPHHPDVTGPCDCRKPALGLYHRAARDLSIDFERSVFIGDRVRDVHPARELGGSGILVRTGHGVDAIASLPDDSDIAVASDLPAAVDHVLSQRETLRATG